MSTLKSEATRRRALRYLMALPIGASVSLSGCWWLRPKPPTPICPDSSAYSYICGPLTVDAHCHIFNGTDLPVKEFVSKVFAGEGGFMGRAASAVGAVLEGLAWKYAPTGKEELVRLTSIEDELHICTTDKSKSEAIRKLKDAAYSIGREQLQTALRQSPLVTEVKIKIFEKRLDETSQAQAEVIAVIEGLEDDWETYKSTLEAKSFTVSGLGDATKGIIDFVLQNFNYRYTNIYDYLDTYNEPNKRVVDLIMPSMVDYDFWLARGRSTLTHLAEQADVMEKLSIVTRGRVHGFIPFDPLREIAFKLKRSQTDSMSLVKKAIEKQGFIGVKLYPPMGFAPLGNESIQKEKPHFWRRNWLEPWVDRPDLGRMLDEQMRSLFTYCAQNEIPIMAHTSISNGVDVDFKELASSKYWKIALAEFNSLRINFGHFGDTSIVEGKEKGYEHAEAFARLMNSSGSGQFAYADAGFFTEVLSQRPALLGDIQKLYDSTIDKGNAALANRFLYGTDWEMSLTAGAIKPYLSEFVEMFKEIRASSTKLNVMSITELSDKFFGQNAAIFAGLCKGDKTRSRLDAFYAANKMAAPDWMKKLDAQNGQLPACVTLLQPNS